MDDVLPMTQDQAEGLLNASTDSVLIDVKRYCGIGEEDPSFDMDICTNIDVAMSILVQVGVIASKNLQPVQNDSVTWIQLIPDQQRLSTAKAYVKLKVRLLFDPPSSATVLNSLQASCDEFLWRAQFAAEYT